MAWKGVAISLFFGLTIGYGAGFVGTGGGMMMFVVLAGAATELFSPSEWDTMTVPLAIMIVSLIVLW